MKGKENERMHISICALNHHEDAFCFSFDILPAKEWNKISC